VLTPESVSSRFSITSACHDAALLAACLPWKVVESDRPHGRVDFFVTVFDLGLGRDRRVDDHLERATDALFRERDTLERLEAECGYALWVQLRSRAKEVVAAVPERIASRLAYLRVELQLRIDRP
jgi:hypothetical protein